MTVRGVSNKSKSARRVIEILEFFDENPRSATAMEIARRYGRPQSSTWELLSSLVELGLLYKDPGSRLFCPTPRAAMLGSTFQPPMVRDGRLSMLVDSLTSATGLGVVITGLVGLDLQVFRWAPGTANPVDLGGLWGGARSPVHQSAAGWLLLSTVPAARRETMLRRLRAEAPEEARFSLGEISEKVEACAREQVAIGPAGFGAAADMCAVLLPAEAGERPVSVGFIYDRSWPVDAEALTALLQRSLAASLDHTPRNVVDLDGYRARGEDKARHAPSERMA